MRYEFGSAPQGSDGGVVIWRIDQATVDAIWWFNMLNNFNGRYGIMPLFSASTKDAENTRMNPFLNSKTGQRDYIPRDSREIPEFWPSVSLDVGPSAVTEVAMLKQYDACDVLDFSINGVAASVDAENHTILLPTNTDIGEATPQFTLSPGAFVEKELQIQPPNSVNSDFSLAAGFRIMGADGYSAQEWTVAATPLTVSQNLDGSIHIQLKIPLPRPHQLAVLRAAFDDAAKTLTDVFLEPITVDNGVAEVPAPAAAEAASYKLLGVDKNNLPVRKLAQSS